MLNNVKNFVISKKEAFKVGYDPSELVDMAAYTGISCAIGAGLVLITNTVWFISDTIRGGERRIAFEELKKFLNDRRSD